tara:strand:+ start:234 stop:662 length:429 start_codon:yes stop_codon:yes gene_type:complete
MTAFDTAWSLLKMPFFEDLPQTTQDDITYLMLERNPHIDEEYKRIHPNYLKRDMFGMFLPEIEQMEISRLTNQRPVENTNAKTIERYKQMLNHGSLSPPIIVSGNQFVDGGHRLHSHIQAGLKKIPTINIGDLLEKPLEVAE